MKSIHRASCCAMLWLSISASHAQTASPLQAPPPENLLQLSASGSVEVPHDQVTFLLGTTREAPQATAVQEQLKAALDKALAELRPLAQEGQMDVRTGGFNVHARYGRDAKIQSWVGTAEVILEGRDIARISRAAARVDSMTVSGVSFGLSREQQRQAESRAQQQAIERFRSKAAELSRAFGFGGYALREVNVQSSEQGAPPRPRMMAMEAKAASADSAVPVEPGKATVLVSVSGTVQMRPGPITP